MCLQTPLDTPDRRVAAQATQMAAQARIDIAAELQKEEAQATQTESDETEPVDETGDGATESSDESVDPEIFRPPTIEISPQLFQRDASELSGLAAPVVNVDQLLANAGLVEENPPGRFIDGTV